MQIFFKRYFELIFWIIAIGTLAIMPPSFNPHYSFCLFKMIGINFCPGCGLGHSISHLFHGNFEASFLAHPLGAFAILIIALRIYKLVQLHIFQNKNSSYAIREH